MDLSRVKVCHKPEGGGNGSNRTITLGWDGVADHLGHGDVLSTCEFALADGHSRAMANREAMVGTGHQDPSRDARIGSMEQVRRNQTRSQQGGFGSTAVANPYPANPAQSSPFVQSEGGQTAAQREGLRKRIERSRDRN